VKDILFDRLQFGDLARHLLLTGGDPVDALPYRVEVERNCVKLLLVGRGAAGAAGAPVSGVFRATGVACGTDQPSRGNELAIISLAAPP